MSGIFSILNLSTRALFTSQTGIELTSHNIANVNTPGYAKQELQLMPEDPTMSRGLWIGSGVKIRDIRQAEDRFLNYQLMSSSSLLGNAETSSRAMDEIQEIFNETNGTGLSQAMNDYFLAWSDLSNSPEGQPERTALKGKADVLVSYFHQAQSQIDDVRHAQNNQISGLVKDISLHAQQIADLNSKIMQLEASGQTAGDYRSQRVVLMEELAQKINYTYFEDENGMVTISLPGGKPLVEGVTAANLTIHENVNNDNLWDVYFKDVNGVESDITSFITGGQLGGCFNIRDNACMQQKTKLDELAFTLVQQVNSLHINGYGLNGTTGHNFFTPLSSVNDAASLIAIDPDIVADVNNIAAAGTDNPGDNSTAVSIAALRNAKVLNNGTWTLQDHYSAMIGDIGVLAQNAKRDYEHQDSITNQIKTQRESVVGVSIEEEFANLIKYQQSYQASARLFNTASEMADILANLKYQ